MKLFHLLVCSIFTFFVLYAPQPILPLIAQQFHTSAASVGALMTATMLPLAIAPLVYGIVLTRLCPLKTLKYAFITLALSCVCFSFAANFEVLMIIRVIQGLLLPACLTAMTTYLASKYAKTRLTKVMSWYVLSTIAGGFLARVSSASVTEIWHWQGFYWLLACVLMLLGCSINTNTNTRPPQNAPILSAFASLFSDHLRLVYLSVFCMFFCFTALLNYLPFILRNDYEMLNTQNIGLVYSGYLIGALFSALTPKLNALCKSSSWLLVIAFLVYNIATFSLLSASFYLFFIGFTVFCGAMFIIHSVAAPLVNQLSNEASSLTNGMYVSFYYSGGALGSFLPGLLYQHYGKQAFILCLLAVCSIGLGLTLRLATRDR